MTNDLVEEIRAGRDAEIEEAVRRASVVDEAVVVPDHWSDEDINRLGKYRVDLVTRRVLQPSAWNLAVIMENSERPFPIPACVSPGRVLDQFVARRRMQFVFDYHEDGRVLASMSFPEE